MPRVLLVDDSPTFRKMNRIFLRDLNLEVLEASNGEKALRLLQKQTVDILITDDQMPLLTCLQLCEILRGSTVHRPTVILMLTSYEDHQLTGRATRAGVRQVIAKREGGFAVRRAVSEALQLPSLVAAPFGLATASTMPS